jgi:Putative addiction module component
MWAAQSVGLIVDNRCRECSLPLDQVTVDEKLKAIEMLWDDFCRDEKQIPVAEWQNELLEERQRQIETGEAKSSTIGRRRRRIFRFLVSAGLVAHVAKEFGDVPRTRPPIVAFPRTPARELRFPMFQTRVIELTKMRDLLRTKL